MFERIAHGLAGSPVSSTTAADVSSHDVSMPEDQHRVLQCDRRLQVAAKAGCPLRNSNARLSDSVYGARKMPRSVMMPAMNWCGVTSNAGFQT